MFCLTFPPFIRRFFNLPGKYPTLATFLRKKDIYNLFLKIAYERMEPNVSLANFSPPITGTHYTSDLFKKSDILVRVGLKKIKLD